MRIIFAKNQYEFSRTYELQKKLVSKDKDFINNWMEQHFKAEAIASIEGRLFKDVRQKTDKVSKGELKTIQKQAAQEYEHNAQKLKAYTIEAQKQYSHNPDQAKMFAHQELLFEERYGAVPSAVQQKMMRQVAEHGYRKFKTYQDHYTKRFMAKYGEVSESTQAYIEHISKYRITLESRNILKYSLTDPQGKLPDQSHLKTIASTVEKEFKRHKDYYEKIHDQHQKIEQDKLPDQHHQANRNRDRGMER